MKRIKQRIVGCFYFVFFLSANTGMTQNQSTVFSPPLKHEKKVYTDSSTQRLYWPMDKPVYIFLSESPDQNNSSFLLNQKVDDNGVETEALKEGIKLELSGNQFVRWVNSITSEETRLHFFSDGEPPLISDSLHDAPRSVVSKNIYFGHNLKCKIMASDKLSGVKNIYYSIDGKPFQIYTNVLTLNTEKSYHIRYYAVDQTGYSNTPSVMEFIVDLTSPESKTTCIDNFKENTLSSQTKIKLTAVDKLSGVDTMYYKFDNDKSFVIFNKPVSIDHLSNGEHTLSYYAVDKVENNEPTQAFSFYLDKEPPKPSISVRGEQYEKNDITFMSTHSLIQLNATDDKIGVDRIFYAVNKKIDFLNYENPFPLSMKSGQFFISYFAKDKFGNTSDVKIKLFHMDMATPKTMNKIDGPHYSQRSTVWITKETKISLSATDAESGLRIINYFIANDPQKDYKNESIQIEKDGNYLFRYFSFDNVGNREGDNVLLLIVDNFPPDIKEIYSVSPTDSVIENNTIIYTYPQYTTLFLAATDMSSGIKGVWYSINSKPRQEYFNSILCDKEGKYEINVIAKDNLDHTAEKRLVFNIKKLEYK